MFGDDFREKMRDERIRMESERDFIMEMTERLGVKDKLFKMLNLEMKAELKLEQVTDVLPNEISEEGKDRRILFLTQINALLDQFLKGENHE